MGGDAAPRPGPRRSDRSGLLRSTPIPDKPSIFHLAFSFDEGPSPFDADAILDIGNRLGRASADFSACLSGMAQQFFRQIPSPFRQDDGGALASNPTDKVVASRSAGIEGFTLVSEQLGECRLPKTSSVRGLQQRGDEDGFDLSGSGCLGRPKGNFNITLNYDSRTNDIEGSLVAKGDLWRAEVSQRGSTSGNDNSPLFLVQLGPVLLVRDSTLLLPVHISKQHLLWYGYDRKNGLHSLCPAIWSMHRRWLFMSMICLNPLACSFMELQFPNGQLTYIAGEGLTHSAFLPAFGGLLQAQGQYPGETCLSFSYKHKFGTQITPLVHLPDKSFSLGIAQTLSWKRSGLMMRPSIQISICPTIGGSNPGVRAELIHSLKEKLSIICGFCRAAHSSAFASLAIGRSKWNGYLGRSGVVIQLETPPNSIGRPNLSIQLNSGFDF
ncbi:hypothetical protein HPP92_005189 [Vanilla planifolia]|uniref:Uncharacterized protein n=1 Tax=Vanilla planifolia TaxID=51239 RepID=A0A835RN15_VANPL|nr:hypothetical protein HPP92_005189 [Vanilla planifolia]